MVEVCFGDSEKGMVSVVANKSIREVVCLFHSLDLGRLGLEDFKKVRQDWIKEFFNKIGFDAWLMNRKQFAQVKSVLNRARKGEPVRIWTSDNPTSLCGFYCLVYLFQEVGGQVYRVHFPRTAMDEFWIEGDADTNWGMLSFGHKNFTPDKITVPLNAEERSAIAEKWVNLVKDNGILRIREGDEVKTVPEDFFDKYIEQFTPDGIFSVKTLAGRTIAGSKHFICDSFIMDRILLMIKQGKYIVVEKDKEKFYNDKIRKA